MTYNESRRRFLRTSGVALLGVTLHPRAFPGMVPPGPKRQLSFYAGTYTDAGGKGIYRYHAGGEDGGAVLKPVGTDIKNPSFITFDRHRRFLYAVCETDEYDGRATGGVYAYAVDPITGSLQLINHRSSGGAGPCHLSLDHTDRFLFVANYTGGSVAAFPLRDDGGIAPESDFVQHHGSGPVKDRQQSAHAHCVGLDLSNRYVMVADLGMDRVMIYSFDSTRGTLVPAAQPFLLLPPGSGPRHFVFHPDGDKMYIIAELNSTVTAAAYDREKGVLRIIGSQSTLPAGYSGENAGAEVCVAPSGRFVYCSNRGHNSIAVFAVHPDTGALDLVQHQSTGVHWPRNFAIDPSGQYLLVANQRSDSVVLFLIDEKEGTLSPGDLSIEIPSPVCVQIVPPR